MAWCCFQSFSGNIFCYNATCIVAPAPQLCRFLNTFLLSCFSVKFGTFDILSDEEVRQGLKKFSNWPTYPQLYVNGQLIGGLDIVKVGCIIARLLVHGIYILTGVGRKWRTASYFIFN